MIRRRGLMVCVVAIVLFSLTGACPVYRQATLPLLSAGVGPDGRAVDATVPISDTQRAWLDAGTVPGPPQFSEMAERALLDLHSLQLDNGAVLAAPVGNWRYVWPRDASFAAAAFARTGHGQDALAALMFLADVQDADGSFQARYLPDGSGVPDERGAQLDGVGWMLWAVGEWYASDPVAAEPYVAQLYPMIGAGLDQIRGQVDPHTGLAVSSDYWELPEKTPTLGTEAALLAGVRGIQPVLREAAGMHGELWVAQDLEKEVAGAITTYFAAHGYPRYVGGDQADAAITFLGPPFASAADSPPSLATNLKLAWTAMSRPGGGVAPGAGWKRDGVSWTPETALFALAAAGQGDGEWATSILRWLSDHRTAAGCLPEKVLADGSPASVAPLAWTDAIVLLTLSSPALSVPATARDARADSPPAARP